MRTLVLVSALTLSAEVVQNNTTEKRFAVPTTGPVKLILDNVEGSLTVTAGGDNEIRVTVRETWSADTEARMEEARKNIRIDMKQDGGTVDIYADGPFRDGWSGGGTRAHRRERREMRGYRAKFDFEVRVPARAELDIATVNRGDIRVAGVRGPFEVRNVNGDIEMADAGTGGTAHTVNGPVTVAFASAPTAASSFKTVNGGITATLPANLNADVWVRTFNGEALTDFDTAALPMVPTKTRSGDKYVYSTNRSAGLRIGRGGVEMKFETLNGKIRIEKRGN